MDWIKKGKALKRIFSLSHCASFGEIPRSQKHFAREIWFREVFRSVFSGGLVRVGVGWCEVARWVKKSKKWKFLKCLATVRNGRKWCCIVFRACLRCIWRRKRPYSAPEAPSPGLRRWPWEGGWRGVGAALDFRFLRNFGNSQNW